MDRFIAISHRVPAAQQREMKLSHKLKWLLWRATDRSKCEWLTPREAAERLDVPERRLARWRDRLRGPLFARVPAGPKAWRVFYRASDIEAYAARREAIASADRAEAEATQC